MKKIIKKILFLLLMITTILNAQNNASQTEHHLSLKTQFFQVEEAANYGLVFNGLNLATDYDLVIKNTNTLFSYSPGFGFGANFNKGIGLNWSFKPIDVFYGFRMFEESKSTFFLGPYLAANYQFQLYPELQSGHNFWFTFIDFGPRLISEFEFHETPIKISIANSIGGFGSRPEVNPQSESHFYSLNFLDWVNDMNSNFKIGSFNLLNHTNIEVELSNFLKDGLSLAYEFEYFGYFEKPELNYLSHSLNLTWCIGISKEFE